MRKLLPILFTALTATGCDTTSGMESFDIQGIKLGMTVKEAQRLLPEAELKSRTELGHTWLHLNLEKKDDNGYSIEELSVDFASSLSEDDGKVNSIYYSQTINDPITLETLIITLTERYGEPTDVKKIENQYSRSKGLIYYGITHDRFVELKNPKKLGDEATFEEDYTYYKASLNDSGKNISIVLKNRPSMKKDWELLKAARAAEKENKEKQRASEINL
ncbi:hypothetical protein [Pseudomonas zhanjiangensis]|uniref:Lipoprotein n=1 Tax=Pseudomonas zhanjiangensis TaxID=3239015 RepID=A0ABV3Z0S7_9PSED